jgi:membrane protein
MIQSLRTFLALLRTSFQLLKRTEPLVLSSSTAFFTTFALSPILILLLNFFGLYFRSDRISNQLFGKIATTIGTEAAIELESIVKNFMEFETTWWITTGGIVLFLFISTTLLTVIRQNIHKLWRIRKTRVTIKNALGERLTLIGIILTTGIIFLSSVLIDSALAISFDYLQTVVPQVGIVVIRVLNVIFSVIMVTLWFMVIFKALPHAKIDMEVAFTGAFLTAILFNVGRMALGKVLIHARIVTIFGASASFALLLLFIFYCSFILYFGAAFTHEYGEYSNRHICAGKYAHEYEEKLLGTESEPAAR